MQKVIEGSNEQWMLFVERYSLRLEKMFRRKAGENLFDDICQETFIAFFRTRERFTVDRPVMPYLGAIFIRKLYTRLQADRIRKQHLSSVNYLELLHVVDQRIPKEPIFSVEELENAMKELPEKYRAILVLEIAGVNRVEISALLEKSPGATYTLLSRARSAVREKLLRIRAKHAA